MLSQCSSSAVITFLVSSEAFQHKIQLYNTSVRESLRDKPFFFKETARINCKVEATTSLATRKLANEKKTRDNWSVLREDNVDPPIQTENFHSGGATMIFIVKRANAVSSSSCAHWSFGTWPCHLTTRQWRANPSRCRHTSTGEKCRGSWRFPLPMNFGCNNSQCLHGRTCNLQSSSY